MHQRIDGSSLVAALVRYVSLSGALLLTSPATADEPAAEHTPEKGAQTGGGDLDKKLQNPVASLISLPFQYTVSFDSGPYERTQHSLNLQPVVPVPLSRSLNLILRAILPLLSNPDPVEPRGRTWGVGDLTLTTYVAPAEDGALIAGLGPALLFPTATDETLGYEKLGLGPSLVMMAQPGAWSLGALITQLWSVAGDDARNDVSLLQLQPIFNYRLSKGWSVGYIGIITADWEASSDQRWTVPIAASVSRLFQHPGAIPVNVIVGGGVNAVRPDAAGDWFLRLQVNLVLPGF